MSYSRNRRRKSFRTSPSSKVLRQREERLRLERHARLKARVGEQPAPAQPRRNDLCPCGQTDEKGKRLKYKKCCIPTTAPLYKRRVKIDEPTVETDKQDS